MYEKFTVFTNMLIKASESVGHNPNMGCSGLEYGGSLRCSIEKAHFSSFLSQKKFSVGISKLCLITGLDRRFPANFKTGSQKKTIKSTD